VLCVEEWSLEYTGYFAGSVPPTRGSHGIDRKASIAVDANHPPIRCIYTPDEVEVILNYLNTTVVEHAAIAKTARDIAFPNPSFAIGLATGLHLKTDSHSPTGKIEPEH
jgi:hypothetical protein